MTQGKTAKSASKNTGVPPKPQPSRKAGKPEKGPISLYPLDMETALAAAIATGPLPKKHGNKTVEKKRRP
jgi:hypothetical protein